MNRFRNRPWLFKYSFMVLLLGLFNSPVFAVPFAPVPTPTINPAVLAEQSSYAALAASQTHFGLKFFQEILKENPKKNVLISPFSAATALGMVYNGAADTTKDEMTQTLGLDSMDRAEVNRENKVLTDSLQGADPKVTLNIANSLWGDKDFQFKTDFMLANTDFYKAEVHLLDFTDPDAFKNVNQWVSDKTMGKIPTIIGPLTKKDKLVLVNAVYFKAKWTSEFKKENTKPAPFHMGSLANSDRPMMHQTTYFPYLGTDKFQAIRLPYGNRRLSLLVFLPSKGSNLAKFCAELTFENWNLWIKKFKNTDVDLSLPKFKIEFSQDLKPSLTVLGMIKSFSMALANFTDMAIWDHQRGNLFIGKAIQKTYMLLDEGGTEAAAATAFQMYFDNVSAVRITPPPVVMTVDGPFFIALVDDQTKALLFTGAIYDPQSP